MNAMTPLKFNKMEQDLMLLSQTGILNYDQWSMTGIHGYSKEIYRVSAQSMKDKKLIETSLSQNRKSVIQLSAAGKAYLRDLLPEDILEEYCKQIDRQQPMRTSPQFEHRLNTNTFYCCYLSMTASFPGNWILEMPYCDYGNVPGEGSCRCDGYLSVDGWQYYVEQDNCTQRSGVLYEKVRRYLRSGLFDGRKELEKNVLIFSIDCKVSEQKREEVRKKEGTAHYKICLQVLKLWNLMEHIAKKRLCLSEILECLDSQEEESVAHYLLSSKECRSAADHIRKADLPDDYTKEQYAEHKDKIRVTSISRKGLFEAMDLSYTARYATHYMSMLKKEENLELLQALSNGMQLYAIPLHDIIRHMGYLMPTISGTKLAYENMLSLMGISFDKSESRFWPLFEFRKKGQEGLWLRNVFAMIRKHFYAAFEDIGSDIGAYVRSLRALSGMDMAQEAGILVLVMLVENSSDARDFYKAHTEVFQNRKKGIIPLFFVKIRNIGGSLVTPFGLKDEGNGLQEYEVYLEEVNGTYQEVWEEA